MSLIHDKTSAMLESTLDLRWHRQHLLASNIANMDTPHYQPKDVDFQSALSSAMAADESSPSGFAHTHGAHLSADGAPAQLDAEVVTRPGVTNTIDGNGVDLDTEMAHVSDNALRFNATTEINRQRFALLRHVISTSSGT